MQTFPHVHLCLTVTCHSVLHKRSGMAYPLAQSLHQAYPATNAPSAAFHRWLQGEQAMANPHDPRHQVAFHEHPRVEELLEELQTIEEKEQVEGRFYTVMGGASQNER